MTTGLSSNESQSVRNCIDRLIVKDEEVFDDVAIDEVENVEPFNFALPPLSSSWRTPLRGAVSTRRQTISDSSSLLKERNTPSDDLEHSIYCTTPGGGVSRSQQSIPSLRSPSAQLIESISRSPLMRAKRATKALDNEKKKVNELMDKLEVALSVEEQTKKASEVINRRWQEEKQKSVETTKSLQVANRALAERDEQVRKLERKLIKMETTIGEKNMVGEQNQRLINDLERQKVEAEQIADELKIEIEKLRSEVVDSSKATSVHKEQFNELTQKCTTLERSLESMLHEKNDQINDYKRRSEEMRRDFQEKEEESQLLIEDVRSRTADTILKLQTELENAQNDRESVWKMLQQQLSTSRGHTDSDIAMNMERIQEHVNEILETRESMKSLTARLNTAEEKLSVAHHASVDDRKRIRELEAGHVALSDDNQRLLRQISDQKLDIAGLTNDVRKLEITRDEMRLKLERTSKDHDESRRRIEDLEAQLRAKPLKESGELLAKLLEDCEQRKQNSQSEKYIDGLMKKLNEVSKENDERKRNEKALGEKISELEAKLSLAEITNRRRLLYGDDFGSGEFEATSARPSIGSNFVGPVPDLYDEEEPVEMENKLLDGTTVTFTVDFSKGDCRTPESNQPKASSSSTELAELIEKYCPKSQESRGSIQNKAALPQTPSRLVESFSASDDSFEPRSPGKKEKKQCVFCRVARFASKGSPRTPAKGKSPRPAVM